ncbi:gamma-glutamyltranspeptidase [Gigaspora margarita]|uniref:Gamma-glutamyltranspeptidase n=1 Tax=Gigaspora margarita TaxID=4874 RepID=A0A8H4A8L9_GIGMA|nr:gamma-glutamyltranspeptidase [Gigaspora margarita]
MCIYSQPLACHAGLEILKKGGNAADAAIAVSAALNVTEPTSTGIGGDCFCLFYDAKTKKVSGLNGSGRSPANLTLEHVLKNVPNLDGKKQIPDLNINAVTVPGAAAGWVDTVDWFGSGRLKLAEILKPAIDLAENGYPVSEICASMWKGAEKKLLDASTTGKSDMLIDGHAPGCGEIMKMPNLARTFRELAEKGKDGFYKGRIAQAIVDIVKCKGGVMSLEDLASHTSARVEPISIDYKDVTIFECPPNGQGITALMALGIIQSLQECHKIKDLSEMEHNSAEYLHVIIESLRLAFADSTQHVTDPDFYEVTKKLLSKEYLSKRAQLFDPTKAITHIESGLPVKSSDTVYFTVVDDEGNACSFINSNYNGFGTCVIPEGCGFTLHNRGSGFFLEKRHPNCLEPCKRPYNTIIPAIALRRDELWISFGVMGAFMQPQGHVQVLLNLIHHRYDPQTALDAPRIRIEPLKKDGDEPPLISQVSVEEGISDNVIAELRKLGHSVEVVKGFDRSAFGRGQIIERKFDPKFKQRVWAAGSDLRGDGHAVGW